MLGRALEETMASERLEKTIIKLLVLSVSAVSI